MPFSSMRWSPPGVAGGEPVGAVRISRAADCIDAAVEPDADAI